MSEDLYWDLGLGNGLELQLACGWHLPAVGRPSDDDA